MSKTRRQVIKSTVFVSPEQRKLIAKSGKTLQQFFTDLLSMYVSHSMGKWRLGHVYHQEARMVFMRAKNMNQLLELLPDPYKAGRILGEETRRINLAIWNLDGTNPGHREILLKTVNGLSGWGIFSHPEPDKLVLESPAFTNEAFVRGFVEGALGDRKLRSTLATATRLIWQLEKD